MKILLDRNINNSTRRRSLPAIIFASVALFAMSMTTSLWPQLFAQDSNFETKPTEQINVIGEKTKRAVHFQLQRAESVTYRMFNELNDSRVLDIKCRRKKFTGSYIFTRVCEPVFLTRLRSTNAIMFSGIDPLPNFSGGYTSWLLYLTTEDELKEQAADKYEEMNQKMFEISQENPEFRESLVRVSQLQSEIDSWPK